MSKRSRDFMRRGKQNRNLRPQSIAREATPRPDEETLAQDQERPSHDEAIVPRDEATPPRDEVALQRDEAPAELSTKPSSAEQADRELPPISGAFFLGDVRPRHGAAEDDNPAEPEEALDEEIAGLQRSSGAWLRYAVAGAAVTAGVVIALVVNKTFMGRQAKSEAQITAPVVTAVATSKQASAAPPAPPPAEPMKPAPSAEAKADEAAAQPRLAATAAPENKAEPAHADRGGALPKASDPPSNDETLKRQALSLLNKGALEEAIPVARQAVAADPTDALGYLYLGSALQGAGKWKEGLSVYSDCVRNATRGPVSECRLMGGHK